MANKNEPPDSTPQDENQIIAERRAKLARCASTASAFPTTSAATRSPAICMRRTTAKTNEELEGQRRSRRGRRPHDAEARDGQGLLRHAAGHERAASSSTSRIDALGADAHEAFKHWDLGDIVGADRHAVQDQDRRAVGQGDSVRLLAKALRPLPEKFHGLTDQEQRYRQRYVDLITNPEARDVFEHALADRAGDPRVLRRARLPRSRDADDAADPRRRGGAAVRDAPQRARHGAVPAHRAGALPEAARRRRPREGVRDQPQLPQRRHLDAAQPRVHDARVLRGLPGLSTT